MLSLLPNGNYKVMYPIYFNYGTMEVPVNFETDLMSVPHVFKYLGLFKWGSHTKAAIIHDFGYRRDLLGDRRWWDRTFREEMIFDGTNWLKANAIYWACRGFGMFKWNAVRRKKGVPGY